MGLFFRKNIFVLSVATITVIALFLMLYVFADSTIVSKENLTPLAYILRVLFVVAFIIIGLTDFFQTQKKLKNLFTLKNLLILSIILSLILSISKPILGYNSAGVFVFVAFIYFLKERKLYAFNKVYIFLFLYAFMIIIGAFFTDSSFKFPEKIYSFLILPVAFCFFHFEKQTYLRILRVVFRVIFAYICISIVFWIYNVEVYDESIKEWMTTKLVVDGNLMTYELIGFWSLYPHPSYISLVLLSTLIAGFYLYFKKDKLAFVSLFEIVVFSISLLILELAYESRIGVLEAVLIIIVSIIYYMRLKRSYIRLVIFAGILLGSAFFVVQSDKFESISNDNIRKIDYTLAVNYIKDHFWWGAGTERQKEALEYQENLMKDLPDAYNEKTYVHNQFLGEMVQFGIVGLIVLIIVLSGLVYHSIKTRSYLLQLLLFMYILFMMIEEPWYVQPGISRFIVFYALFVAIGEVNENRKHLDLRQLFSKSKSS